MLLGWSGVPIPSWGCLSPLEHCGFERNGTGRRSGAPEGKLNWEVVAYLIYAWNTLQRWIGETIQRVKSWEFLGIVWTIERRNGTMPCVSRWCIPFNTRTTNFCLRILFLTCLYRHSTHLKICSPKCLWATHLVEQTAKVWCQAGVNERSPELWGVPRSLLQLCCDLNGGISEQT